MKLENMRDVIIANLSEGYGGPHFVAKCIRNNETCLNIYCDSKRRTYKYCVLYHF